MTKIVLLARIKARQNSAEIVKSELLKMVEPTRKETGCIEYQLYQDNKILQFSFSSRFGKVLPFWKGTRILIITGTTLQQY